MNHPHKLTKNEIKDKYDGFARWYDVVEAIPEFFGVRSLRRDLASRARGKTLEVAAGSGKNLRLLPDDIDLVAGDISKGMLNVADRKARKLGMDPAYTLIDAEQLPFLDNTFDTVLSTLSTCTFPDPTTAIKEMSRVCKPDGCILLLEHGRSSNRVIGWYQDSRADSHASQFGCQWNRHPVEIARGAGLEFVECRTHFFDIFVVIEAKPAPASHL